MKPLLLAAAVLLAASGALAQSLPDWAETPSPSSPSDPVTMENPGLPGGGGPVSQVPLDGGLGLLALAGGAYAVRRLRQQR